MVKEGLSHGTVYVFGYHGKLQEVMQILHDASIEVPFVVPERIFHVSMICQKHGMRLGRLMLSEEREAKELLERNSQCIAFYHMNSGSQINRDVFRIYVSGWEFDAPCREISKKEYVIALSDHSDFDGLIEYVRLSKPKFVITDNFRVGHAETLAKEIRKKFGISATALPKK
jgi:putative mRNA 3-end processing factor